MKISEVVDGFVSEDEADDYVAEEDVDFFDEEDDDDGNGGSKALTKKLEELKAAALERSRAAHQLRQDAQGASRRTATSRPYNKASRRSARADDDPLHRQDDREAVRHAALAGRRRAPLRARDRKILVDKCGMPQAFHQELPAQRSQPEVGREGSRGRQALQRILARNLPAVRSCSRS
jgi:RNA polymerase primary sigma factor